MPLTRQEISTCLSALSNGAGIPFVVIGGASVVMQGSNRTTDDVDILVPENMDMSALTAKLGHIPGFSAADGKLKFLAGADSTEIPIDILTHAVQTLTFHDLGRNTIERFGIKMMRWDYALGVKMTCHYYRADDENGERKKRTDARDMVFLSQNMIKAKMTIADDCAARFKIGYYHMMVIREALTADEFAGLVEVGIEKLLQPWEENTDEQKEYYLCMADEGTNPLTVPLEEIEE